MRTALRRLARFAVVVFVVHSIAGNLFLNTALGPWAINRKPERFHMTWSYGVTWWPGFVALWNVETKGHSRHVLWNARAAHVRGRIALLPLLGRELHVVGVDAADVSGSIDRSEDDLQPPAARPGGWTLRFDRMATDSLRDARVMDLEVNAIGSATFGFVKQLRGGPLQVLPSRLAMAGASMRTGDRTLLRDARVDLLLAIAPHRREDASGLARLALTDATIRIDGLMPGLTVELDASGRWRGAITDAVDSGRIKVDLAISKGLLETGGMLELQVPLGATRGATKSVDAATLRADIQAAGTHLVAHLPPPPEGTGSIDADLMVAGTAIADYADVHALLPRISGTLDIDWHFDSLDWFGPLLVRSPWLALDGSGRVDAALKVRDGLLEAGSRVDIPQVSVTASVAGHRFRGRAHASGNLVAADAGSKATVDLTVARYDVVADEAPDVVLMHGRDLRIGFEATGELRDFRESAQARLRFDDAEVPDLRALNAYLPGDALSLLGGVTQLDGDLAIDADGRIARGRIGVQARRARAQVGEIGLAGDFDLDGRLDGSDLAVRRFDLDNTTLRLRNVKVIDDGRTAGERWWANINLDHGQIEARRPFHVAAHASIEMQDIGLLLALFTKHRDYPRWALRLVDAGSVRATGRIAIDGKTLVFDRVEANNDRYAVKARMRIAGKQPTGDLLLRWGILALGVEVDKGIHATRVIGATRWYEGRAHLLDAR